MLKEFSKKYLEKEKEIEQWLKSHLNQLRDPIYSSVDVRNAGFKLGPVDTNIFPGGFNNLCPSYLRKASELFKKHISKNYPTTKKILIVPEKHTRNQYYFSNLKKLETALIDAGYETRIGSINTELNPEQHQTFETADGQEIILNPIKRVGNELIAQGFNADLYLLNNDLAEGIPDILKDLAKPLVPSPESGWHSRKKSDHFALYEKIILEFAELVGFDSWLLHADFFAVNQVDFTNEDSNKKMAEKVDELIAKIQVKYDQYKIKEAPYVFIKNNSGTYGMGITTAHSGKELLSINRKLRNKLNVGKSSIKVNSVIIQEGLPTTDRFQGLVAEPVIYLVNNEVTGGFFRLNDQKDERSNLNSKGMKFSKLCFHEMTGYSNTFFENAQIDCLSKIYKTVAQIASIAAGYETLENNM